VIALNGRLPSLTDEDEAEVLRQLSLHKGGQGRRRIAAALVEGAQNNKFPAPAIVALLSGHPPVLSAGFLSELPEDVLALVFAACSATTVAVAAVTCRSVSVVTQRPSSRACVMLDAPRLAGLQHFAPLSLLPWSAPRVLTIGSHLRGMQPVLTRFLQAVRSSVQVLHVDFRVIRRRDLGLWLSSQLGLKTLVVTNDMWPSTTADVLVEALPVCVRRHVEELDIEIPIAWSLCPLLRGCVEIRIPP